MSADTPGPGESAEAPGPRPDANERAEEDHAPWPQRLYESIWLWAGVAVLFWLLSYVVWGFVDLIGLPGG